jgi:hypothetical protein
MTHVQGLRHGAEVRLDAGGERGGDGERGRRASCIEPQKVARRRRGAVHAESRGRVPALVVVVEIDAEPKLALGLEARDIGRDEGTPVDRPVVGERKKGRQNRCRRMPAQGVVAVVEVERVRGGAVDQRGVERARAVGGAEHEAACAGRGHSDPAENLRGWLHAAGDRDAYGIEDADLGRMHCLWGQILEPQCGGSAGKFV